MEGKHISFLAFRCTMVFSLDCRGVLMITLRENRELRLLRRSLLITIFGNYLNTILKLLDDFARNR
jgi:hypothetical protein